MKFNVLWGVRLFVLISCLWLSGCTRHLPPASPESRAKNAASMAKAVGWKEQNIHTHLFVLKSYESRARPNAPILTVYIEGDGLAWIASNIPSDNPTPVIPTGLKMAIHDKINSTVVYLGRPCQFVSNVEWWNCRSAYWTNLRFSPDVVNAMNQAVSHLKKQYHSKKVILIGYSGGGTIAALVAAKRKDVIKLITVAAMLDMKQWIDQKSLTPLYGSLNPADEWSNLTSISQTHWVGGNDAVVPVDVAFSFANRFPSSKKPKIKVVPNFDHICCWATDWTPS